MSWKYATRDLKNVTVDTLLAIKVFNVTRFEGPLIHRVVSRNENGLVLVDDYHARHLLSYDLHYDHKPALVQVIELEIPRE